MHLSFALLVSAPLAVLAGPLKEEARAVKAPTILPDWAKNFNGKCTSTRTATKTVTSTRKTTKYPKPTTTTVVVVKTVQKTKTLPAVTDVFSTTSTIFETTTATEAATVTETETTTITNEIAPETTYIPAPADFTPIRSVFPTAQAVPKRDLVLEARKQAPEPKKCVKPGDMKCKTTVYKTVTKGTKTRYVTSTATARRSTVTKKGTRYLTTTLSVLPSPASSTSTFSTTSTLTETITNTATETVPATTTTNIVSGPTPTAYAACGDDNILSTYNGKYIDILYFGPPGGSTYLGSKTSAYECCVACLNTPGCAGAGYLGGTCIGLTADVSCSANLASGQFGASAIQDAKWRVSNSGCGQWSPAAI